MCIVELPVYQTCCTKEVQSPQLIKWGNRVENVTEEQLIHTYLETSILWCVT